jgi:hypothetical protein
MVSVALTGILMVGMSVFFSSTFRNMFQAQTQSANTEKQFAVNEIIRDKFTTLNHLVEEDSVKKEYILSLNKVAKNQLPFSYMGKDDNNHLVFKDILIFNKILDPIGGVGDDHIFANSGEGNVLIAQNGNYATTKLTPSKNYKNFSSFELLGKVYYVVLPNKNEVLKCDCTTQCPDPCEDLSVLPQNLGGLNSPTDIVSDTDGNNLYISDSGNGRILKYEIGTGWNPQPIAAGLKYPTGLTYYKNGTYERLFFAETLNNKVKSYNITGPNQFKIETIVGDGEDAQCNKISAKFCKLSMPTGLYAFKDTSVTPEKHELYIADSGNNRILKVSDPGKPTDLRFQFDVDDHSALDRIVFENGGWSKGTYNANPAPAPDSPYKMLIGNATNYDNTTRTFSNPNRMTVYSVDEATAEGGNCKTVSDNFYVNEEPGTLLVENGDWVYINDTAFEIKTISSNIDCRIGEKDPKLNKWKITVDQNVTADDGDTVFFSNPKNIFMQIDVIKEEAGFGGFNTTTIKIYDIFAGLVSTNYYLERIGDSLLGTSEDMIEAIAYNKGSSGYVIDYSGIEQPIDPIIFPTGVTNYYFANSGFRGNLDKAKIVNFSGKEGEILNAINTTEFKNYDYVSDFTLADADPIKFTKYNSDKILELVINAKVDEENIQTYTLNATLP